MPNSIAEILDEMKSIVEQNDVRSPAWWLDQALKLAVLRQDLQSELVKAEILFRNEVVLQTNDGVPYNKAENMTKGRLRREGEKMTAYEWYNYLRTRDAVVEEILRICKKRASINTSL